MSHPPTRSTLGIRSVLDALISALEKAADYNQGVVVAPAAILWTDENRHWESLIPRLRTHFPVLLTLGNYAPSTSTGPAIWIRAVLARELEGKAWPADAIPILYLPGISRQMLRAVESCPPELQPLAELQYRSSLWTQSNARDWTPFAFLKAKEGLGLDVAQDKSTAEALQRALTLIADTDIEALRGRKLEAADFYQLLSPDTPRDLLRWMSDPEATQKAWQSDRWAAFREICGNQYNFDPQFDGPLTAGELLAEQNGAWASIWTRFSESPRTYPGIRALLEKVSPRTLIYDPEPWPRFTIEAEDSLRKELLQLDSMPSNEAAKQLLALEQKHGMRRSWVWAELGMAPLAGALKHLAALATLCSASLTGSTPDDMAERYRNGAWKADIAALKALASTERLEDQGSLRVALQAVYRPWLSDAAERLQELVRQHGYPGERPEATAPVSAETGECLLFTDGLRYDVGEQLRAHLEQRGHVIQADFRWSALPSVTATSKPAVSPVTESISGFDFNDDFEPSDISDKKQLTTARFRRLLTANGYQVLLGEDLGDPSGKAWAEFGDLDTMGHDQGWKLARRIEEQVREIAERIESLLNAGWKAVKVVTDHGWLLLAGGLPKVELPKYLTDTRWSRCAALKTSAQSDGLFVVDWRWERTVRIALAPGIGAFKAGLEYTHGGLSLQECLTPTLMVQRSGGVVTSASIEDVAWRGLRCRVKVRSDAHGLKVDIRTKPTDAATSVVAAPKAPDVGGTASLAVPDDTLLDSAAHVVVLDANGTVIAKTTTCIGGGD